MAQIDRWGSSGFYRKRTQIWLIHRLQMHLQRFFSAHVEHVSYCQSHIIWVGTFKAKRTSLVTVLLQHLHTVTHKHTLLAFPFLAFMPLHHMYSQLGSRVQGLWTKTLPVNCIWMDLIRWWFILGYADLWVSCFVALSFDELSKKWSDFSFFCFEDRRDPESGWGKRWRLNVNAHMACVALVNVIKRKHNISLVSVCFNMVCVMLGKRPRPAHIQQNLRQKGLLFPLDCTSDYAN